ncbi:MAG TPA: 4Fe-4S dicluster domain-containing protein [Candidatus Lokiarchaeia archaeon]|nr:4Fe-4S dicluster domain-containing protein [Candidatus Lokiarchaeia archaeon]
MSDREFQRQIYEAFLHDRINYCYQCNRCDDNCPVHAETRDFSPRQLILTATIVGMNIISEENRLKFFGCTDCDTCDEVCPVHIPITHVIHVHKNLATAQDICPDSFKGEGKSIHDTGTSVPISPAMTRRRLALGLPEKYDLPINEVKAITQATGFESLLSKIACNTKNKGADDVDS